MFLRWKEAKYSKISGYHFFKGVHREKSAVFKELVQNFRTYELRGQAKKKKNKKF